MVRGPGEHYGSGIQLGLHHRTHLSAARARHSCVFATSCPPSTMLLDVPKPPHPDLGKVQLPMSPWQLNMWASTPQLRRCCPCCERALPPPVAALRGPRAPPLVCPRIHRLIPVPVTFARLARVSPHRLRRACMSSRRCVGMTSCWKQGPMDADARCAGRSMPAS